MRIDGATALVTGASSGIGRATALELASRGARLLVCGRDRRRLDAVARSTGAEAFVVDLADRGQTDGLAQDLMDRPPVDLVVHNAGIGMSGAAESADQADIDGLLAVNVLAPMRLTQAVLPRMRARGQGHLVFVSSIAGVLGVPQEAHYAASKGAVTLLAASLRDELAHSGIGVTTVIPGVVRTSFFERRGEPYQRASPRPVSAELVARRLVRGVERELSEVVVPGWLRVPIALHATAPQLYARLARRWA
ncbi:MAG TPA: SDR family NAD(P)-dependent oxidoreductase [Nocardioidaceae bacterium]|nr:SDR family NAD(P)-dependent oxidoreductase [Nocardioidaceae bacterium]